MTSIVSASAAFADLLLNEISGNCFALKKSGLFRCWSRFSLPVSTLSVFTTKLTAVTPAPSSPAWIVTSGSLKRPYAQLAPMCLILKTTNECTGSPVHVPSGGAECAGRDRTTSPAASAAMARVGTTWRLMGSSPPAFVQVPGDETTYDRL